MNRRAMFKHARFAAIAALLLASCQPEEGPLAGSSIGGPFTLTDTAGKTVKWSDFAGKYRVVYFGYAYCPDICPLDVQRIMKGYELFKAREPDMAAQVQPIFITVDPERDTKEVVAEFLSNFPEGMIGLTGTPDQVKVATEAFKVHVEKLEANEDGAYLVNHSNIAYLMGRQGEPLALLPVDVKDKGAAIAAELARWTS